MYVKSKIFKRMPRMAIVFPNPICFLPWQTIWTLCQQPLHWSVECFGHKAQKVVHHQQRLADLPLIDSCWWRGTFGDRQAGQGRSWQQWCTLNLKLPSGLNTPQNIYQSYASKQSGIALRSYWGNRESKAKFYLLILTSLIGSAAHMGLSRIGLGC